MIILTGHQNRRLDGLGICQEVKGNGKPFYCIFLDDPHPKEIEAVNRPLSHYLRKICTKRFLKQIWDAYLVQVYLHEVGHAKYIVKNGQRGSEDFHEDKAEEFAWRWMEKLFDKEVPWWENWCCCGWLILGPYYEH